MKATTKYRYKQIKRLQKTYDISFIEAYRLILQEQAIADYFERPIKNMQGTTNYCNPSHTFDLWLGDRLFNLKVKVELDIDTEWYYAGGNFGNVANCPVEGIRHAIKNTKARYSQKYYIPWCYLDPYGIRYEPDGFNNLVRQYNQQYSKHESYLKAIAEINNEYEEYSKYVNGQKGLYYISVEVNRNGILLVDILLCLKATGF